MGKSRCGIDWNILHSNLTPIAKLVFFEISVRAYQNDKPFSKKMFKSPSNWLIDNLKISKSEFEKAVTELVKRELIIVTDETDGVYKTMGWQILWENVDSMGIPSYVKKKSEKINNVMFKKAN